MVLSSVFAVFDRRQRFLSFQTCRVLSPQLGECSGVLDLKFSCIVSTLLNFYNLANFRDVIIVVGLCTVAMLTAEELCALNRHNVTLPRAVRKTIFRLRLWQMGRQRLNSQCCFQSNIRRLHTTRVVNHLGLSVGCINACSVSNKSAMLCRACHFGNVA